MNKSIQTRNGLIIPKCVCVCVWRNVFVCATANNDNDKQFIKRPI